MLRSESHRDYVDGLLFMEHLPNTTVIGMAHIVANHAFQKGRRDKIWADIRLRLSDRSHEGNTSSEIASLRKIGCVLELNGMFNSKVEEQLHPKFDSNKKVLNMITPANHIYLFRSIRLSQQQQK